MGKWGDIMMHLVIKGNPITKKNSQRIVKAKNGRPFIIPSKQYKDYEKQAIEELAYIPSLRGVIDYPVNVKCIYYMQTRRKCDLVNLQEATLDILVKAGILADDNSNIVCSMDGSRVMYDKENPRVIITIESIQEVTKHVVDI